MVYNYKTEYTDKVCEGKVKVEQEVLVAKKIIELLNQNKYDNLEDFMSRNKTLQDFLKNNHMETAIKHFNTFGNPLNEQDYVGILSKFKEITKKKENANFEDMQTTKLRDKEYNSMKIVDENGQIKIVSNENGMEKENNLNEKSYQKKLVPTNNTIYAA